MSSLSSASSLSTNESSLLPQLCLSVCCRIAYIFINSPILLNYTFTLCAEIKIIKERVIRVSYIHKQITLCSTMRVESKKETLMVIELASSKPEKKLASAFVFLEIISTIFKPTSSWVFLLLSFLSVRELQLLLEVLEIQINILSLSFLHKRRILLWKHHQFRAQMIR